MFYFFPSGGRVECHVFLLKYCFLAVEQCVLDEMGFFFVGVNFTSFNYMPGVPKNIYYREVELSFFPD